MEFVDRSVESGYALTYDIPYEDTDVTSDEVQDSRTHQFVAICRQTYLHEDLPQWITMDDVQDTVRNDEDFDIPSDDDILEFASAWDGCWQRISGDSERRAITDAMASEPVIWETETVPSGVYMVLGYTYEPPFNLWAPRAGGVVRVHDGGDPAASGPAAAISTGQQSTCSGDTITTEGCVDALPGTTMTAFYTTNPGPDPTESTWDLVPGAETVPVDGEHFVLEWEVPAGTAGTSTILRIDFTDPNGNTYTAYQYDPVIVLTEASAGCTNDADDCTGVGDATSCEETEGDFEANPSDAAEDRADGCRFGGTAPAGWSALGLLGLLTLRPRTLRRPPPTAAPAAQRRGPQRAA